MVSLKLRLSGVIFMQKVRYVVLIYCDMERPSETRHVLRYLSAAVQAHQAIQPVIAMFTFCSIP